MIECPSCGENGKLVEVDPPITWRDLLGERPADFLRKTPRACRVQTDGGNLGLVVHREKHLQQTYTP